VAYPVDVLALTLHEPDPSPAAWRRILAKHIGESCEIAISVRKGSGAYYEFGKAISVVTETTAAEIHGAAVEYVERENIRCADFRLAVVSSKGRRISEAVRVRGMSAHDDAGSGSVDQVASRDPMEMLNAAHCSASTNNAALLNILAKENSELRDQVKSLTAELVAINRRFTDSLIDVAKNRGEEQNARAAMMLVREEKHHSVSAAESGETVSDEWYNSEPLMQTVASGFENVTSLIACVASSLAGAKLPT